MFRSTNGIIVGSEETQAAESAISWSLSGGTASAQSLTFSSEFASGDSLAIGLNDLSPSTIIGRATRDLEEDCLINDDGIILAPFEGLRGSNMQLLPTPQAGQFKDRRGGAWAVNNQSDTPSTGLIGGCNADISDDGNIDGALWEDGTGTPPFDTDFLTRLEQIQLPGEFSGVQGIDINESNEVTGWARDDTSPFRRRAAHWETPSSTPTLLGEFNGLATVANTVAYGMTDGPIVRVVGDNELGVEALLWRQEDDGMGNGVWDPSDGLVVLEDEIPAECAGEWELIEAHDINNDGWIVGWGLRDDGLNLERHAFLLVPTDFCTADIDLQNAPCPEVDFTVSVPDLLQLLANWGADGPGANLAPPLDTINVSDLLEMLANWGACTPTGNSGQTAPQSVDDCLQKFELGSLELEKCIEAVEGEL